MYALLRSEGPSGLHLVTKTLIRVVGTSIVGAQAKPLAPSRVGMCVSRARWYSGVRRAHCVIEARLAASRPAMAGRCPDRVITAAVDRDC